MTDYDLVIRGGQAVVGGDLCKCDIGVSGGRITAISERLGAGREEVDATDRLVLPGGVDGHCHLDQPTADGSRMADDFESGTRSAACGGTTTVIPFALQRQGETLREAVNEYHRRATNKAYVDYAFHMIVTAPTQQVVGQELPALIAEGYTSFKIYMTYPDLKLEDREILDVLAVARTHGGMVMIHAENDDCVTWLTERLLDEGVSGPPGHAKSRPVPVEREATHRAITLSEIAETPILIVHVSSEEAAEQIRWARGRGMKIYAETCPQYLFLTAEDLGLGEFEGAKCICSPPPRDAASQQAIWRGLTGGLFDIFSSDHAPFRFDDVAGKKVAGESAAFTKVPNGVPGLETRLPLLFSEGVQQGRLSLSEFVRLTATRPAQMYGLYPKKGTIAIGADADIAVWNQDRAVTIRNAELHHNVDYTPYEGMELRGWPETVISKGRVVCRDGKMLGAPGDGTFIPCERPGPALA
jgi:dihydropyrimidinase